MDDKQTHEQDQDLKTEQRSLRVLPVRPVEIPCTPHRPVDENPDFVLGYN